MLEPEQGEPDLVPVRLENGREGYELRAPTGWCYEWEYGGVRRRLLVPNGFRSDGGSVPWCLWTLLRITPDGLLRRAFFVHDVLYWAAGTLPRAWLLEWDPITQQWVEIGGLPETQYTRSEGDHMLGRIAREDLVDKAKRRAVFVGVRVGGWLPWLRHRRARRRERKAGLGA